MISGERREQLRYLCRGCGRMKMPIQFRQVETPTSIGLSAKCKECEQPTKYAPDCYNPKEWLGDKIFINHTQYNL